MNMQAIWEHLPAMAGSDPWMPYRVGIKVMELNLYGKRFSVHI